ncbi:MAG: MATE family efflux transporter [Pseudomonadota bacterium]
MAAPGRFTQGSIMSHIAVMTSTASVGLMALFLVDLADLYFLSLLGEAEVAAAVGFSGSILFFSTSICIGIAIAMSALVSLAIGGGKRQRARRSVVNVFVFGVLITIPLATAMWLAVPWMLRLLGAEGYTLELAISYLRIVLPSMPILVMGMSCGGALRAVGDAKGAMYTTLAGGAVNAIFDPLFIFALAMGVDGAATASVLGRFAVLAVGLRGVIRQESLLTTFSFRAFRRQTWAIVKIAGPAMMTNVATPIGYAFVTASIARFGDGAVAGYAVVGRIIPVAFGIVFALSGAVGPIFGQNFGAGLPERVRRTFWDGLIFSAAAVFAVSIILYFCQGLLIHAFDLDGEAADLVAFFATFVAVTFVFNGAQFMANAAFNNLQHPDWSTWSNWARATIGTIPFVWLGAELAGAPGVLAGQALGGLLIALLTVGAALTLLRRLPERPPPGSSAQTSFRVPLSPYTLYRGWVGIFSRD